MCFSTSPSHHKNAEANGPGSPGTSVWYHVSQRLRRSSLMRSACCSSFCASEASAKPSSRRCNVRPWRGTLRIRWTQSDTKICSAWKIMRKIHGDTMIIIWYPKNEIWWHMSICGWIYLEKQHKTTDMNAFRLIYMDDAVGSKALGVEGVGPCEICEIVCQCKPAGVCGWCNCYNYRTSPGWGLWSYCKSFNLVDPCCLSRVPKR